MDTRAHDLLWSAFLRFRYGPLSGILEVFVAKALSEQRDSCRHQHYGLGQRSAPVTASERKQASLNIVNIGPSTGFGFQLLVDMIRFFPVSHVVQLDKSGYSQSPALTPEFLRTAQGYHTCPPAQTALDEFTECHNPPRNYTHIAVQSEFQGVTQQGTS